ncbi:MAG: ORC1-type DNA replication protein [TACK group archaeon]|nr:ORC1-type DNA replication protein [TACK group archaeon]
MSDGGYEHLFDEIGYSRKIFKEEAVLFPDYVPSYLPHRDSQMRDLVNFFRVSLESPGKVSQKVLCSGRVGVGKTAVTKLFSSIFTKEASGRFGLKFKSISIDCRKERTLYSVLQSIISSLDPYQPYKGFSARDIHRMVLEHLENDNSYLLLVLDEVDYLIDASGSDAVYELTRDERGSGRMNFIFISRSPALMGRLDESTKSTLLHNQVIFPPYSAAELRDILMQRVPQAFQRGAVDDEVVTQAASLGASSGGDARLALELLWRAGKRAEAEGRSAVTPEDVRVVFGDIEGVPNEEELLSLPTQSAVTLLAVARALISAGKERIATGEAEKEYLTVCEEYGIEPRAHTAFWEGIQSLKGLGFLSTEVKVERKGRTTMIGMNYSAVGLQKVLEGLLKRGAERDEQSPIA